MFPLLMKTIDSKIKELVRVIKEEKFGMFTEAELELILQDRNYDFEPVLVRLSSGLRFQTVLQYLKGMMELVKNSGDSARDVSFIKTS